MTNRTVTIVLKDEAAGISVNMEFDPPILTEEDEGSPACWAAFEMLKHIGIVGDEDEEGEGTHDRPH